MAASNNASAHNPTPEPPTEATASSPSVNPPLKVQAALNTQLSNLVSHMCHANADSGHINVLADLLNQGADPTSRNPAGRNAMHEFASKGKWWCLMTLLDYCEEAKLDANVKCRQGRTPLHDAARHVLVQNHVTSFQEEVDEIKCVKKLIQLGVDINARDRKGWTALHYAVYYQYWPKGFAGTPQVATFLTTLLDNGADMHAANWKGETALYMAAMEGSAQCEILMLLMERLENPAAFINAPVVNHGSKTLFHWVARYAEPEPLLALISKGADINAIDVENRSPLIFAVQFENWSVIQPLLGKGADAKHVVLPSGNTAMHYCAERHHVNSVKRLAEAGASVTHPNIEYGFTPIDSALRTYEEELITYGEDSRPNIFGNALAVIMELKRLGGSQDAVDREGNDPVHRFCDQAPDHPDDMKRLLLAVACNHEAPHPWTGFTPLHVAALRDCAPCVRHLVSVVGVDVNRVDFHGQTALHIAARAKASYGVVDALVKAKIDVNLRDKIGETAADKAQTYGGGQVHHPVFEQSSPKKPRNSM